MHELMHGLGPHQIAVGGSPRPCARNSRRPTARWRRPRPTSRGCSRFSSSLTGAFSRQRWQRPLYETFLASAFRAIRFGVAEAHGRAVAMQLNYLLDFGAFKVAARTGPSRSTRRKIKGRRDGAHARDYDAAG